MELEDNDESGTVQQQEVNGFQSLQSNYTDASKSGINIGGNHSRLSQLI